MSENANALTAQRGARKGDGATFLVVADDSEEFKAALRYASMAAKRNRGYLGILRIIEDQEFQNWGAVEALMKKELRIAGESYIWSVAGTVNEQEGLIPSLYFAEGEASEALMRTIESDPNIVQLVLGAGADNGPGPLVSYLLSRGLQRLRIPVVVIPGSIKEMS